MCQKDRMKKTIPRAAWNEYDENDGIQSGWRDKLYLQHRLRLRNIKPKVTESQQTPRHFPSNISRNSTTFTREQYREIQMDNNRLLNRLTEIANKTPKKIIKPKKKPKQVTTCNDVLKRREISRTNKNLVQRIINAQSTIKHDELKKHRIRHDKLMRNKKISKWNRKNKKPKGLMKYSLLKENELKKLKQKTKYIKKQYKQFNEMLNNNNNSNNNYNNIHQFNDIHYDTILALNKLSLSYVDLYIYIY